MKLIPLLILLVFSIAVYAYPVDEEGNLLIPETQKKICLAKGDVTMFVYQHRDGVSKDDAFKLLERDWDEAWKGLEGMTHATYVDMQRIINDAYRTNGKGDYRRDCCTEEIAEEETMKEIGQCIIHKY